LHTYLLSSFDNLVIFLAQPYLSFALQKLLALKSSLFFNAMHVYEVRPRKDHRRVNLISDVPQFGCAPAKKRGAIPLKTAPRLAKPSVVGWL